MIDRFVVGGFYRVHGGRSNQENLNAPGSSFRMLAFAEPCSPCGKGERPGHNHFWAYGVCSLSITPRPMSRQSTGTAALSGRKRHGALDENLQRRTGHSASALL